MNSGRNGREFACAMSLLTTTHIPADDNNDTSRMTEVFLMCRFWIN